MKVYQGLDNFRKLPFAVVTSGTFDGVHLGHQKILSHLKDVALSQNGETVVITYWPHPRLILHPEDESLKLLSTIDEKIALLEKHGVDHLVILAFTTEFSQLTSEEFIRHILIDKIGTKKLVIGYDHRFGRNREGSFEHLKANSSQYGFEVEEISRQDVDNVGVSSTKIRNALNEGKVKTAADFLGAYYSIKGKVIHGNKLGRTIGFPTANINIEEKYKLIPTDGVYAVFVILPDGKQLKGMLNIGIRPTVDGRKSIEAHIFDFEGQIYDEHIQIQFVDFIRYELKFPDLETLKEQLQNDKLEALSILNSSSPFFSAN